MVVPKSWMGVRKENAYVLMRVIIAEGGTGVDGSKRMQSTSQYQMKNRLSRRGPFTVQLPLVQK